MRLAGKLARKLRPGDVVAFFGDLGSGKTTFIRGMVDAIGDDGERIHVKSPSFVLLNIYPARIPVYHLDFYRLDGAADVLDLGIEEYIGGDGIAAIEWAERAEGIVPPGAIRVTLRITGPSSREISVERPAAETK